MIRLCGTPVEAGVAFGTAIVIEERGAGAGPPAPVREQLLHGRGGFEPADVVVVARDDAAAASFRAPWARVVGVAIGDGRTAASTPGVPQVAEVPDLLESVKPDDLVLIDGDRGVVLVDPSGAALARYQAEHERLSPRERVYVEFRHQPPQTLDGRELRVLARVTRPEDVVLSVEAGADGLVVADGLASLHAGESAEEQFRALCRLIDSAPGKPVVVCGEIEATSVVALLQASVRADLTLAVASAAHADGFRDLMDVVVQARETLIAARQPFGTMHLAGTLQPRSAIDLSKHAEPIHRLIVPGPLALDQQAACQWLDRAVVHATRYLVPVQAALASTNARSVRLAVGLGAAGLIVPPGRVAATKDRIRALDASACREAADRALHAPARAARA